MAVDFDFDLANWTLAVDIDKQMGIFYYTMPIKNTYSLIQIHSQSRVVYEVKWQTRLWLWA